MMLKENHFVHMVPDFISCHRQIHYVNCMVTTKHEEFLKTSFAKMQLCFNADQVSMECSISLGNTSDNISNSILDTSIPLHCPSKTSSYFHINKKPFRTAFDHSEELQK